MSPFCVTFAHRIIKHMKKEVKIVLGSLFGDEGKGSTVQWLCKKAIDEKKHPLVIRFSGGPQAGHEASLNGITHSFSSFGSGTLLGVPTAYMSDVTDSWIDYQGMMIDPIAWKAEYEDLQSKGVTPPLYHLIYNYPRIITPFDVIENRKSGSEALHGTCGKGIFRTFNRYKTMYRTADEQKKIDLLWSDPKKYARDVARRCYGQPVDAKAKELIDMFADAYEFFRAHSYNRFIEGSFLNPNLDQYDVLIFEGSQGLLLDMQSGFMPNCTPSNTGLRTLALTCQDLLKDAEVYLTMRTYLTRHGNGYTPNIDMSLTEHLLEGSLKNEANVFNEWQGEFKVGLFDCRLLNRAFDRHLLDQYDYHYGTKFNLVVTHCDDLKLSNDFIEWPYIDKNGKLKTITPLEDQFDVEDITKRWIRALLYNVDLGVRKVYYSDGVSPSNFHEYHSC